MLEREGVAPVDLETVDASTCPACGCAQPPIAGACADCGLQLEWA
jgi:uncharacterized OB-fold protein